ncbi:MAG: hypothetical protein NZM43_10845 [Saprospiraceae bacterium]|nr:hypothetical protein [Saprospiraceae bacterium]MDW8484804.1 hypothetical protein [Saprospiraceae bacterium]
MHLRTYVGHLVLLIMLLSAASCREDIYEFRPYEPVAEDMHSLFEQIVEPRNTVAFHFEGKGNPLPDTILSLPGGARLHLDNAEELFENENGVPVPCSSCADLRIEATLAGRKSDWVARQLPQLSFPDGYVLESVGILHLQVRCAAQRLRLRSGRSLRIQLPISAPLANAKLFVFSAHTDTEGRVLGWIPNSGALPYIVHSSHVDFELFVNQLGWLNCARVLSDSLTSVCVNLPQQFTALNTRIFLFFQHANALVELSGNTTDSNFCSSKVPLGHVVHAVVVAKTGKQYWMAQTSVEITANMRLSLVPKPVSQQDIVALLRKF